MSRYPREILESYVRDHKGQIHQMVPHKVEGYIHLRRGNNYKGFVKKEVGQKVVDGSWRYPNEHELTKFIKQDNKIINHINQIILKRVILTNILLEVDDELIPHFEDDSRSRNLLQKSQAHLNRKNAQLFVRLFGENEEVLQNLMKAIDGFLNAMSGKKAEEIWRVADLILRAEEDNELYDKNITLNKLK